MRRRLWAAAVAVATAGMLVQAAPAHAAVPALAVALGDSYISGEAGRWQGNSDTTTGGSGGTDRSWNGTNADATRIYGSTFASGCHRSDIAPVTGASLGVDRVVNLACSGATSQNVLPASRGGQPYKGEAPQIDQLAALAGTSRIKMVVLSVGGNDLGFGDIIAGCIEDWFWGSSCSSYQQSQVNAKLPAMRTGVASSIQAIRDVMRASGHADTDYRLVLQAYPSPVPRGFNIRYSDSGWTRWNMGCPVTSADATWVRDRLVPQLSTELRTLAAGNGTEFLDLRDAFDGREICARGRYRVDSAHPASDRTSEWVREFWYNDSDGRQQETFHPNAYGQKALSRCLTLLGTSAPGNYKCLNTAGAGVEGMRLTV
ncbi:GDSL-type esterase/lipase family protein [Longispora albida]|uniref:GDSL-type esterase/lipase family protein n=1 Tax=Longispora albida TaxID=203523 RepID=UPI0003A2E6F8|nr:GDSL-type esterase/lipase family protein [Longispora albida]